MFFILKYVYGRGLNYRQNKKGVTVNYIFSIIYNRFNKFVQENPDVYEVITTFIFVGYLFKIF